MQDFSNHIVLSVSYLETACWLKVLTRNISLKSKRQKFDN